MGISATLTADLRRLVLDVEDDLRARLNERTEIDHELRTEYATARRVERTAATWETWRDQRLTQVAVGWVLATVFIRFCEDNELLKPVWLAGPVTRRTEAVDAQNAFLRERTRAGEDVTDRAWLTEAVRYLADVPATAALAGRTNPLWEIGPSGDMAAVIIAFWRARDESGTLLRDFTDPALDTRFLGDLYQDLSAVAREQFALLQTPEFVEEYILDLTMTPALAERPLDGFTMIDPTCGSGHFLLGAFGRLLAAWHAFDPGMEPRTRVQRALDSVHGVDINPFAVAIAQFRLIVAALKAVGGGRLEDAPDFRLNLAAGDSLIHGRIEQRFGESMLGGEFSADQSFASFGYATEDVERLREILTEGRYDVVVGNPPYITVKDKALNALYRKLYGYCKGTYALTVPFIERFFALAQRGERAGWVGQITSNSFMKREFGEPLIEELFPKLDLTYLIDSEGAWIPGHNSDGTPTVIIVGRSRRPASKRIRVIMGKGLRETREFGNTGNGPMWTSIQKFTTQAGYDDKWITVTDLERSRLASHPWSLTGGGASELASTINSPSMHTKISSTTQIPIGGSIRAGADEAYMRPLEIPRFRSKELRVLVLGEGVRDWANSQNEGIIYPYP